MDYFDNDLSTDSVWSDRREEDQWNGVCFDAREQFEQDQLIASLQREVEATGSAVLVLGKRYVNVYDPVYIRVLEEVPGCKIISELEANAEWRTLLWVCLTYSCFFTAIYYTKHYEHLDPC